MNLSLKPKRIGSILLREITEADYLDYFQIGRNPEVTEYLNWGPFQRPEEALWVIQEIFLKRHEGNLPVGYAITIDDCMVGMIDFHTINSTENSIEIGYVLRREYWGKGIMTKCLRYMTELGFQMGYDKIVLGSLIGNERSIRLIEGLGFQYEYEQMEQIDIDVYRLCRYYVKYRRD